MVFPSFLSNFPRCPTGYNFSKRQYGSGFIGGSSVLVFTVNEAPSEFLGFQLFRTGGSDSAFAFAGVTINADGYIIFDDYLYCLFGAWQYYNFNNHFASSKKVSSEVSCHSFRWRFVFEESLILTFWNDNGTGTNVLISCWYRWGG
jgi:hypothetical protein